MQIFKQDEIERRINKVREGIEFILSHFGGRQQLFPRKISTALSNGRQFTVYDVDQILNECIKANFIDCRINAYPVLYDSNDSIQAPNVIFLDLDLSKDLPYDVSLKQLNTAINKCLKTIKGKLYGCRPTVLWTGNGYHIYIVLEARPLELIKELTELSPKPSEEFLKFAEMIFSSKKKDPCHKPTFRSSLLRIPYTFNSKNRQEVKIIQEFDKDNIKSINIELLRSFRLWLVDKDILNRQDKLKKFAIENKNNSNNKIISNYLWIEKLLETPKIPFLSAAITALS